MSDIVRIAVVRDEEDIIKRNLEWYIDQGFPTIILDNGSSDKTMEICESYLGKGIVKLAQVPFEEHDRELSLKELAKLLKGTNFDSVLLADADEFYQPSNSQQSLMESLQRELRKGYNVVQFHNIEFWMTLADNPNETDPVKRITHYSYFDSNRYKLFPNSQQVDFWSNFGHVPILSDDTPMNVSPNVHISRHYKFRNLEQAYRKVLRIRPPARRKDVSFHYAKFALDSSFFVIDENKLTKYGENGVWNLDRKFDGFRMNRDELKSYLGFASDDELNSWFESRGRK